MHRSLLALLLAFWAVSSTAHADRFVDWLSAHPEVTRASLSRESPIVRARYVDGQGTVLCGALGTQTACARGPATTRMWTESYRRREAGQPTLTVGLGPVGAEPKQAAFYELRFPEGTIHARGQREADPLDTPWRPRALGKAQAALALVQAPTWLTDPTLVVRVLALDGDPWLEVTRGQNESTLCHRDGAWHCYGPVAPPPLSRVEPAVHDTDKRLKPEPLQAERAAIKCKDRNCTLLIGWEWQRTLIAHSYWARGFFVALYRVAADGTLTERGIIRTATATLGFRKDRAAVLGATLVDSDCVALTADDSVAATAASSRARAMLPAPGRYCIRSDGFARDGGGPVDPGRTTWP
jgi:hypothetical protein